jgi:Na+-translocating ferredoxin:NAD+ oxidoreductase subunit B
MREPSSDLAAQVDAWLPQTQCTQCGYPRCHLYAEAIVRGEADINQCPPGGDTTLRGLAAVFQTDVKPLNPRNGQHEPRRVAVIDESLCIGCRKCIEACPVDAIVGAPKLLHTVLAQECTGCGLCVSPCPVDCIAMIPATNRGDRWPEYSQAETERWRGRTERRLTRLARQQAKRMAAKSARASIFPDGDAIRAELRAALERARRKHADKT